MFDFDFGRVGILTCYDGWFPEIFRSLSLKGAELIVWINGRRGSVEDFIIQSAMFQNHVAVISANQAYGGGTMIGDLPAKILARCPDAQEAFITSEVDLAHVRKVRGSSRNFQQRRPDLYEAITQPIASAKTLPVLEGDSTPQKEGTASEASLRVASCQFPVSADVAGNAQWLSLIHI